MLCRCYNCYIMIDKELVMIDGFDDYLLHIRNDYCKWSAQATTEVRDIMNEEFASKLRYEVGTKYIKIITDTSVHSFVCIRDMGKFTKGDILKAASWNSPARNFVRGNTMARDFSRITWTGAN